MKLKGEFYKLAMEKITIAFDSFDNFYLLTQNFIDETRRVLTKTYQPASKISTGKWLKLQIKDPQLHQRNKSVNFFT